MSTWSMVRPHPQIQGPLADDPLTHCPRRVLTGDPTVRPMWASAAAALGRAALGQAATRKGRVVVVAVILIAAIVMVPFLVMIAFFSVTVHVLKGVAVAPPGY